MDDTTLAQQVMTLAQQAVPLMAEPAPPKRRASAKAPTPAVRLDAVEARLAAHERENAVMRAQIYRAHVLALCALSVVAALALIPRLLSLAIFLSLLVAAGAVILRVMVSKEPALTATVRVLATAWRMVATAPSAPSASAYTGGH